MHRVRNALLTFTLKQDNPRTVFHILNRHYGDKEKLKLRQEELMKRGLPKAQPIPGVKHAIMVASGKGGVGKSTTAVNIAAALKELNYEVGLLDTDVFGPTIPLMMNLRDTPFLTKDNLMEPLVNYGIKCMSMGFLIAEDAAVIWRGLMVMQALEKLLKQVCWGKLDYLIIDTPPGTGDTHLSIVQNVCISGVILVTTPQSAAIHVTKRSASLFKKLKLPVIGLVENMSHASCPHCGKDVTLFESGTEKLIKDMGISKIARIPLKAYISNSTDQGVPVVIQKPDCYESETYRDFVKNIVDCCK